MASNSFGQIFRITTWGESHGPAMGVVIDGCPSGLSLDEEMIAEELKKRVPGSRPHTSPRKEKDAPTILSGVFEGKTTGTPISILIHNQDADSSKYEPIKHLLRPGHANHTYLHKYGTFDYRGGGRASARETVCRVAAGAVAKALLKHQGIYPTAYLQQVGNASTVNVPDDYETLRKAVDASPLFCPDKTAADAMASLLQTVSDEGDSIGGVVAFRADGLPPGLGDPVYSKLEARLAEAMMGLPASKAFEIGEGLACVEMHGSQHNDSHFETNHAGGVLGGISSGQVLFGRVAFKPTSSIKKPQKTVTIDGKAEEIRLPEGSRHDPCVAIRAVPVVEAMMALVLADAWLMNKMARL